jgi:rRNA maturation endonuclease Nob1
VINRCPACKRIVRTPRAQHCLWCGHDWHAAAK